jgi:hypothetical protein
MSTPTHDQFTLLYEDEDKKVLYEFKGVLADGCGYMEGSIFETMKELSDMYFDSLRTTEYVMKWDKPEAE